MLEQELSQGFEGLTVIQERLERTSKDLEPKVIQHFNNYVEQQINPKMPDGYSLLPSESASYFREHNGYSIITGKVQTPDGISRGPFKFQDIMLNAMREYKKKTPWIHSITHGFTAT